MIQKIQSAISSYILWQEELVESLLLALLSRWHVLVEGLPWLAKTLSIRVLSKVVGMDCKRVQFTPDLLPSDIIGTMMYDQKKTDFVTKKWPIFTHFLLADEINRAPAKVQSALLEAMAEQQVTIGEQTFPLVQPFVVMATQNPIEQQGTYQLPEAQMDRFLMKILLWYPDGDAEIALMKQGNIDFAHIPTVCGIQDILDMQLQVQQVKVSDAIYHYCKNLVSVTRGEGNLLWDMQRYIRYGASPRGSLGLIATAKAYAFLQDRNFVIPQDVKSICHRVLRHRIILSYDALIDWLVSDAIIDTILNKVDAT